MKLRTRALVAGVVGFAALASTIVGTGAVSLGAATPTPIRAAFYYPWFPETTTGRYHPTLGTPYDSGNVAVIQAHIYEMQYAGISAGIASWWGSGTATDSRLPKLLDGAAGTGFRWTAYYEQEGYSDPSAATLSADLTNLARYTPSPSWLRVNAKPVLFVYAGPSDGCAMVDRWTAANAGRFYLVLKVFPGYLSCASQPDSWHQYAPAAAADRQGSFSYSISPGFWPAGESTPRLARDEARFATNVRDMVASGTQWQLVTTFNEWGEGSSVEPATEWGSRWLDVLHANGAAAPAPSASPSQSSSPSATVSPSPSVTISSSPTVTASPSPTSPSPTPTPPPTSPPPTSPPPSSSPLIVVWFENHERSSITTSGSADYLNGLRAKGVDFTGYFANTHPSFPNYAAFAAGTQCGKTTNTITAGELTCPTLWGQLAAKGVSWGVYEETMPSACYAGASSGRYVLRHNPATPFREVFGSPALCANVLPFTSFSPSSLRSVSFITPNLCNDMHDCSIGTGDDWLQARMPSWLAAGATVVVTFDEGSTNTNGGGNVYAVVVGPGKTHSVNSTRYNHYSLLAGIEVRLGLPRLAGAASAVPLPI